MFFRDIKFLALRKRGCYLLPLSLSHKTYWCGSTQASPSTDCVEGEVARRGRVGGGGCPIF